MFAYMRSKRTESKISRTKSMAVVCYAVGVKRQCRIGVAVEQSSRMSLAAETELSMQEAGIGVKQASV
jgi:hypothetical protein